MASMTNDLVGAVREITPDSLTAGELEAIRTLFLDFVGVTVRGSETESAATVRRALVRPAADGAASAVVIGPGTRAAAIGAAMANAVAGHSIEYDDVYNGASLHPGVVIFPTALAAIAMAGGDDIAFVQGVAVGYEVMCRVGRAVNPASHYKRHFHPTGTVGSFGAAATAASILGCDHDEMVSALGIAGSMASGSLEFLVDGAWTKRLHPALAARGGLEAALLAADGFIGTKDAIGGPKGFLVGYSDDPERDELLAGWGERPLAVAATSIKAHTCCRYNQGPIDAVLELRSRHSIRPASVGRVTVGVPSVAVDIVAEPGAAKRRPASVVDAQFSLPFGVAVALVFGRAGLDEYQEKVLDDPGVRDVMDRVDYVVDPELDAVYPERWPAWVRIELDSGPAVEARVGDPKGDPPNPLTAAELVAKFDSLTDGIWDDERRAAIVDAVGRTGEGGALAETLGLLDNG